MSVAALTAVTTFASVTSSLSGFASWATSDPLAVSASVFFNEQLHSSEQQLVPSDLGPKSSKRQMAPGRQWALPSDQMRCHLLHLPQQTVFPASCSFDHHSPCTSFCITCSSSCLSLDGNWQVGCCRQVTTSCVWSWCNCPSHSYCWPSSSSRSLGSSWWHCPMEWLQPYLKMSECNQLYQQEPELAQCIEHCVETVKMSQQEEILQRQQVAVHMRSCTGSSPCSNGSS